MPGRLDVYLVRHAVAHARDPVAWPDDRLRTLTAAGEEDFRRVGRVMGRMEAGVGAVLSSPLTRAWQTAGILETAGGWPSPEKFPELAPEDPPAEILAALAARRDLAGMDAVALVGHRPSLHELASYMVCGDPHEVQVKIKKGGIVVVRFPDAPRPGEGVLRALITPDLLRLAG